MGDGQASIYLQTAEQEDHPKDTLTNQSKIFGIRHVKKRVNQLDHMQEQDIAEQVRCITN